MECKRYTDKESKTKCTNKATHNVLLGEDCFDFGLVICKSCINSVKTIPNLAPYKIVKLIRR